MRLLAWEHVGGGVDLPRQDLRDGDDQTMGKSKKVMHGARDAPQFWADMVREKMSGLDVRASALHPCVFGICRLCAGSSSELQWLTKSLQTEYDKEYLLEPGSVGEVRHRNRVLRRGGTWDGMGVRSKACENVASGVRHGGAQGEGDTHGEL